ncbi:MAG: hypothetical protein PHD48_07515 [Alphaproteobacteria bacterium]|nr:hypothetical protein [Alphaproteobacteria bacterium]
MKASRATSFLTGFFVTTFIVAASSVMAADSSTGQISSSLAKKDLSVAQKLLKSGPGNVDMVLKLLLAQTQKDMTVDPDFSNKMMSLAGEYAPQITPPSVPAICADLRRIVDSLKPEHTGTPLFKSVMDASESFSKAPVVVAAGRPNECEQAWLQLTNIEEEALLAQTPGMRGPGLPAVTVRPGIPPSTPSPTDKPSAD